MPSTPGLHVWPIRYETRSESNCAAGVRLRSFAAHDLLHIWLTPDSQPACKPRIRTSPQTSPGFARARTKAPGSQQEVAHRGRPIRQRLTGVSARDAGASSSYLHQAGHPTLPMEPHIFNDMCCLGCGPRMPSRCGKTGPPWAEMSTRAAVTRGRVNQSFTNRSEISGFKAAGKQLFMYQVVGT